MIFIDPKLWQVASGTPIGNVDVGDIVQLRENLVPVDYMVVHQGLPGSMYDASCDGTWLLRKNVDVSHVWNSSNVNTYANSDIVDYLNTTILELYDQRVQNSIKQVKIPYCIGNGSATVKSGANGLSCKIFLLSGYEIGWTKSINTFIPSDGAKLEYFLSGTGDSAISKRIATRNGTPVNWLIRTPKTENNYEIFYVRYTGEHRYSNANVSAYLVRPAFVLPQDFIL